MNQFKHLDTLFPAGAERTSGEVVSVTVCVSSSADGPLGIISMKRKAWYVNASVNAFHLHRWLCKEFRELQLKEGLYLSNRLLSRVYARLAYLTNLAYTRNASSGEQYHEFTLGLDDNGFELLVESFDGIHENMQRLLREKSALH